MKIALFSDTYVPDINGVATSTRILRNQLIKNGHEVIVVTSELPSDSDYTDDPEEMILRVPGLELQGLYGYRACNIYSFKGMRELKNQKIDIIHTQTEFGIGIFSRLAAEALNVPIVYTYHTMWADYSHYVTPVRSTKVDSIVKKVISRISKLYGNSCTELIVPSIKTREALEQYGLHKRMHVIPTGLELEKFDPANKDEQYIAKIRKMYHLENKFVITFLGRIAEEKSIDIIIRSVQQLQRYNSNIICLIVGGGPLLETLQKEVQQQNMDAFLIFTGPKMPDLVPSFYHVSDIFVSASLSETQGLTFIEAMASGIPVIARRDKNLEEVVKDGYNGFFFDEEEELLPLLQRVMEMDLTTYGRHAYEDAMQFSSEVFGERVEEVYRLAIKEKYYTYHVKKMYPIGQERNEVIFLFDESEISMEISDANVAKYNIQVGSIIDRSVFDTLKDSEQIVQAYHKALKYLAVKDYTREQMRKKLMNTAMCDDDQLEATMHLLEQKNLINDASYSLQYLKKSIRAGMGLNKAIYNLRSYGIDCEVIDHSLTKLEKDEEYQAAIDLIQSLYVKHSNNSYKTALLKIRNRLYARGFTKETIEHAMSNFNFDFSKEKEEKALQLEYEKQYEKWSRKLSGQQLDNKLIDVLLKKGYNYESIKQVIQQKGGPV